MTECILSKFVDNNKLEKEVNALKSGLPLRGTWTSYGLQGTSGSSVRARHCTLDGIAPSNTTDWGSNILEAALEKGIWVSFVDKKLAITGSMCFHRGLH